MKIKAINFRWTQGKRLCHAGRNKAKAAEAEGHFHFAIRNKQ